MPLTFRAEPAWAPDAAACTLRWPRACATARGAAMAAPMGAWTLPMAATEVARAARLARVQAGATGMAPAFARVARCSEGVEASMALLC